MAKDGMQLTWRGYDHQWRTDGSNGNGGKCDEEKRIARLLVGAIGQLIRDSWKKKRGDEKETKVEVERAGGRIRGGETQTETQTQREE